MMVINSTAAAEAAIANSGHVFKTPTLKINTEESYKNDIL